MSTCQPRSGPTTAGTSPGCATTLTSLSSVFPATSRDKCLVSILTDLCGRSPTRGAPSPAARVSLPAIPPPISVVDAGTPSSSITRRAAVSIEHQTTPAIPGSGGLAVSLREDRRVGCFVTEDDEVVAQSQQGAKERSRRWIRCKPRRGRSPSTSAVTDRNSCSSCPMPSWIG